MKRRPEPAELAECTELLSRFKHVETFIDWELERGTEPGHLMVLLAKLSIEVAKTEPAMAYFSLRNFADALSKAASQLRS